MASVKPIASNLNLVVQETATLTWTIDQFAEFSSITKSQKFSPANSRNEFQLGFSLMDFIDIGHEISVIILAYNEHQDEAFFRYRVSLLDATEDKNYTREYTWHYDEPYGMRFLEDNIPIYPTFYVPRDLCNDLLVNGSLKIYCEVDIMAVNSVPSLAPSVIESFVELSENYEALLESGKWTDFVVAIGDKQLRVHKNILTARSAVFAAMFEHEETQEMKEGRVVIEDVEVEVFELLIRYIYSGKVNGLGEHAAQLLVAADKYQLNPLKCICEQSLISSLTVESVCGVLLLSDMHNAAQLKLKCIQFVIEHAKEVMQTEGWNQLLKTKRIDLMAELFAKLVLKDD